MAIRRLWMTLPLLVGAWGCDESPRDDCPPPASAAPSASAGGAKSPARPFKVPGITKVADKTYGLKVHSVVALLAHALDGGVQVTKLPDAGYRLDVVPPGSPLEQLGLESGDEVRAVAEVTLTRPTSLYRAFRAARRAPLFYLQGRRDGAPLRISYLLDEPRPACPPCEQADAKPPPLDEKTKQAIRRGIRKQPDGSYRVSRKVIDTVLEHQAALLHSIRIRPVAENAQVVGLRLAGVDPDSLLAWLGLQDDDQLISLNGLPITDPSKALQAYNEVRGAQQVELKIKRKGQDRTLTYRVAP